jgi:hypothetical protein
VNALLGQFQHDRAADAGRATGDDGALAAHAIEKTGRMRLGLFNDLGEEFLDG